MAVILTVDGQRQNIDLTCLDIQARLNRLHEIVGGYLESIPIGGGLFLLFWEDAKVKNLPSNYQATLMADQFLEKDDFIAGVAVLAAQKELDN